MEAEAGGDWVALEAGRFCFLGLVRRGGRVAGTWGRWDLGCMGVAKGWLSLESTALRGTRIVQWHLSSSSAIKYAGF